MPQYTKVAAFAASLEPHPPLNKWHPDRIIIDFVILYDGTPVTPMQYKVRTDKTLSLSEIEDIHKALLNGGTIDFLSTGAKYGVLREICNR
jgi:hypothetical protein